MRLIRSVWGMARWSIHTMTFCSDRPVVLSEPHDATSSENRSRVLHQVIIDALPDDVINLDDVFDEVAEPLFVDDVHHNERGAEIIAQALFEQIEDDLRALSDGKDVG